MKKTRSLLAGLSLSGLVLLAACGGGSAGEVDTTELNIAEGAQPPSLDPHISTANATADFLRGVYEPLVAFDENEQVQPVLASEMVPNEDWSEITFTILEKTFHDGSALDSTDVKDSIERWQDRSPAGAYFKDVTWETPDERTLVFRSPQPFYAAMTLLADPYQFPAITTSEAIASAPESGLAEFVGTGPYQFVEWADNQYVHLEKYPEYVPHENDFGNVAGAREAVYDNIYYHIVPDANTRLSGLQTGEYDIATQIQPDQKAQIENDPNFTVVTELTGINGPVFNKGEGLPFANEDLRHAAYVALDMEEIELGAFASPDNFVLNGALAAEGSPFYSDEGLEEYNSADAAKAKEYLDAAGYDGEPITFIATRDYQAHYDTAVVVEQQLKEAGFNITLEVYDWPTVLQKASEPDSTDLYMSAWATAAIPTKYTFMSTQGNGKTNDAKLFEAIDAMHYSASAEEAAAGAAAVQRETARYLPMIKMGDTKSTSAWSADIDVEVPPGVGPLAYNAKPVE
ncbi:ABC transporter substrate-binding protein [Brevibacterium samyangense]|uniref:ABC transporter substrate-binding protein n=1 Tax=Brevibacterium samyangense TaxID=366888 RepID=A0ABP5EP21_9MICO